MNANLILTAAVGLVLGVTQPAFAQDLANNGDKQAKAFIDTYARFCLKHLGDLGQLFERMRMAPSIQGEKAAPFLQGHPGLAWTVPDMPTAMVIAIHKDYSRCAVFARHVSGHDAEKLFVEAAEAAAGQSQRKSQRVKNPTKGGTASTVTYEVRDGTNKKRRTLSVTTTESYQVPAQGIATASVEPL